MMIQNCCYMCLLLIPQVQWSSGFRNFSALKGTEPKSSLPKEASEGSLTKGRGLDSERRSMDSVSPKSQSLMFRFRSRTCLFARCLYYLLVSLDVFIFTCLFASSLVVILSVSWWDAVRGARWGLDLLRDTWVSELTSQ